MRGKMGKRRLFSRILLLNLLGKLMVWIPERRWKDNAQMYLWRSLNRMEEGWNWFYCCIILNLPILEIASYSLTDSRLRVFCQRHVAMDVQSSYSVLTSRVGWHLWQDITVTENVIVVPYWTVPLMREWVYPMSGGTVCHIYISAYLRMFVYDGDF